MPQYVEPQLKTIHNSQFSLDAHRKSNVLSLLSRGRRRRFTEHLTLGIMPKTEMKMIDGIFALSDKIRYVAIY